MKKGLAGMMAAVGAMMFGVGIMITSTAKKVVSIGPPTCGAPAQTSICLYFVEKYGDEFWRSIIITGGVLIGLSIVLFVFPVRKKK